MHPACRKVLFRMTTGTDTPLHVLGLDLGSISLNAVVLNASGNLIFQSYIRTAGRPVAATRKALTDIRDALGDISIAAGVITGSGKDLLAPHLHFATENEIVAHATAAWTEHPNVRSVIEIGGQDSKFIVIGKHADGSHYLQDHAFNELCAAGTGAFLDQQAERLNLPIGEFGDLAGQAETHARVAGRCSVFAKSDMIHLQQKATPQDEIASGLCFALARTYLASLCKGRTPETPVLFQGGVAANPGVMKAFRELLGLDEKDFIRPRHYRVMGALGAARIALSGEKDSAQNITALLDALEGLSPEDTVHGDLPPLTPPRGESPASPAKNTSAPGPWYLGLDVGSVSTKAVIIDDAGNPAASSYVPTAGNPVEAVRNALNALLAETGGSAVVAAAVCTGSGRHLAKELLGAGSIIDEISAQAVSAAHVFPEVDTIIEIGGQDSKYIRMKDGQVERFQMNRACAAGTGSFLEEQSGRLNISIKREFARKAFGSAHPVRLGTRCTVFMDSDLVHHLQRGATVEDLCAGLAYSIGQNYLEKVVGSRPVGDNVLFQGGVACNAAVHAVFGHLLDKPIRVHPAPEVSGALGAALTARQEARRENRNDSLELHNLRIEARSSTFECKACENLCEIRKIDLPNGSTAYFGSICGRFERGSAGPIAAGDAFALRDRFMAESLDTEPSTGVRGRIGIPSALTMTEYLPFWHTFFNALGFSVTLSGNSRRDMAQWGLAHVPAEFCYPMKILFGHVHELEQQGVERIFIPHLRMFTPSKETTPRYACPYTQAAPYVVRAHSAAEILSLEYPVDGETDHWIRSVSRELHIDSSEIRRALYAASGAQEEFRARCRTEGARLLDRLKRERRRGAVLVGRPYNTMDRYTNLNLARRLHDVGIEPIPYDFLPLGDDPLPPVWNRIRWGYGRTLVQAARELKHHPNLGAVIVTNFGCGPDAFVNQYLEHELADTPHILLEFDEHQAEAGLVTRLEAFSRTFTVAREQARSPFTGGPTGIPDRPLQEYTYYIPSFIDHAHAFTGALRASGCRAELLPPTDDESWNLGLKHAYGRECHPFISFTGDLLKAAQQPDFDTANACYYSPSYFGSCLLPQYLLSLHLILQRIGLPEISLLNVADPPTMKGLGNAYILRLAMGIYAIDRLFKWKTESEPYEINPGEVSRVHAENLKAIEDGLTHGRFFKALKESIARFKAIPLHPTGTRPVIGIVGDVYTRVNEHSNNHLYRRLMDMGFEVWTSCSLIDVSFLGIEQLHAELHRQGKPVQAAAAKALIPVVGRVRGLIDRLFPDTIRTPQERQYPDIRPSTERYTSFWIDKALSLNLSRIEEFYLAGADGVINTMCHNCMLGTVTGALAPKMRTDMDDMPLCNLIYEGLQSTHNVNRLEAFAHQVLSRRAGRKAS